MRYVIRLGDSTDHGGKVISASTTMIVKGKGVARVGDLVSCPKKGHGVTAIIEGDSRMKDQGKPIALEGHHAGCGCVLFTSLSNVGIK
ncbi:PAAR domain-containing protein [Frischella perrara]|jgi:Uncharacterized conserved protein|uniref:PAAR domain-containing protein n=1 Tax=Frischella perrara TaxID=1267021 RepID=A0A0A7S3V1_FRIPE|nr:PAAR domain-containing protein [Frischella perrara]AJA46103.1 hypothetical protein FPB0191_02300 [Frischella perrara]MCT6875049.1 PAAR domain-containing protein [Frischella perrara]PWV61260.1 putative Zn-binding protein involved in type VI secretion [Frischella perrara]PXY94439.1 PAAR domain-containing protein [Frischella perrara]